MRENCIPTVLIWHFVVALLIDIADSVPIVNGVIANENQQQQFPFAVSFGTLDAENSSSFSHFCGGSIIRTESNSSWAISAAHCFLDSKKKEILAVIGTSDLSALSEQKFCAVERTYAAEFDQYSFQNDLALVKINCGHQQVIELSLIEPLQCSECVIYGYGALSFETNMRPSSTLRYGSVRPITYRECERVMGRVAAPLPGTGQFCARGLQPTFTDACSGDSGSALICKDSSRNQYELVGIISYGMGCGSEHSAGVYQSVFHHRKWIDLVLQNKCQTDEVDEESEKMERTSGK